jgi:HAD superfamily hydrolase (TIGR01509 family)
MPRIKGIIFDMDGLMVDSEPVQLKAINDALQPLGIRVDDDEFIDMVGRKAIENFIWLKNKHGFKETPEELNEVKNRAYLKRIQTELVTMPGLAHALELCEKEKLITAIASSSPLKDILEVLKLLDLAERFRMISSGDQVKNGKPDPEIFLIALEMLGGSATDYLVLEDAGHGVNAAKAADMYCIAVPNRYTKHQDFSRADRVLNSLEELDMKMINNLPRTVPPLSSS